jgi:hypothetical protein
MRLAVSYNKRTIFKLTLHSKIITWKHTKTINIRINGFHYDNHKDILLLV